MIMTQFTWDIRFGGLMRRWQLEVFWKVMICRKTIVPFCTSQDNDISVSMDYIKEVASGAKCLWTDTGYMVRMLMM